MMQDLADLPPDLRDRLKAELQRGERLIYAARPGLHIGWGECVVAIFYIAFTAFWCGISFSFGFFGWAGALGLAPPTMKSGGPWMLWLFALFSLPFMGIGLGPVVS